MDRFRLENKIVAIHNVIDDISVIAKQILDGKISREDAFNVLTGISMLHNARYAELWETFIQTFKIDEYADEHYHDDVNTEPSTWY